MRTHFHEGLKDGIPILLGYFSVSFGFGILAARGGLSALTAVIISATNVTSAGQLAGLDLILAGGSLLQLISAEFIINLRYALMSTSLTQKLDRSFSLPKRLLCAYAVTDEIFAVASVKQNSVCFSYFGGLMSLPILGWCLGTLLGALAGSLLPVSVQSALGILLYAMFIAIVLPVCRQNRAVALCAAVAAAVSCLIRYVSALSFLGGYNVVVSAIVAAVPVSILFPVDDEDGKGA